MTYQVNIESFAKVDGEKINVQTTVEHVADGRPPEQVVLEKVVDLNDQVVRRELIGPLLDAWECCSQDVRSENPGLGKYLSQINRAMEDAGEPPDVRIEASLRYLENRELNAYAAARYNEPQEPPCPTK